MTDYEIISFEDSDAWRRWLLQHHSDTDGLWMRLYKKASNITSISYANALDNALCFGWIDGQTKSNDDVSYLQKFTPRRKRSLWSKRNIEYVARLSEAGLMMPAGLAEVQSAKDDGRWQAAYDKPSVMVVPDSFIEALNKNAKAKAFFETLNKSNKYAIAWRLQTARTDETRQRRQAKILVSLEAGQKLV